MVASTLGLLLASCSNGDPDATSNASASPTPSSTVKVPGSVSLTDGGKELGFGDAATVVFEPNQQRGTVLKLKVDEVTQGDLRDFAGFILDKKAKSSTPYYVEVSVKNLGKGDVGDFAIPLYGVDDQNVLLQASAFTTSFEKCESRPLPKKFQGGDTFKSCLVYLAPERGTLEGVSFRPGEEFDPIVWSGKIDKPSKPSKPKKPGKKKR